MILAAIIAAIAAAAVAASAYLLSLWHADQADLKRRGEYHGWRSWPFSRVLAYVGAVSTVASTYLAVVTVARATFDPATGAAVIQALTPFTLAAILVLDLAFILIAGYLRILRRRNHRRPGDAPSRLPAIDPRRRD